MGAKQHASTLVTTLVIAVAAVLTLAGLASPASAQNPAPIVMKLSTATINDTQHEWLKRFAAAVEKDSGGRIKGEIYPASQLGAIPRQIEGTQFGSIQGWCGPPEFLVGVDERYEVLSSPGLFSSREQNERTLVDPVVSGLILGLGANKGLLGAGVFPIGPSSIVTRKQILTLSDFAGLKIRVLASQFQLELIKRMGASPIAMTLADVLPALQQGAIDGSLTTMTQYTTLHYIDAAKYVTKTDQPYVRLDYGLEQEVGRRLAARSAEDRPRRRGQGFDRYRAVRESVLRCAGEALDRFRRAGGDAAGRRPGCDDCEDFQHRRRPVDVQAGFERGGQADIRRGGEEQQIVVTPAGAALSACAGAVA